MMAWRDHRVVDAPRRVVSADGTTIAYWTSGSGPPLLLVHGAMSDHRRWRIGPWLEPHRTVHAMDRRGRGGSGDGPQWSLARETEDVVAVVDAVADAAGARVDLLGHSLGGMLAVRAAARTDRIRRLVLYEPAVHEAAQPPGLVDRMQALLAAGQPEDVVVLMMREVVLMPPHEIETVRSLPSWPARVEAAPTLPRELSVPLEVDAATAAQVSVPTLMIVGGDSPDLIQQEVRSLAADLPDCTLAVIPGQQHVADQMVPEEFASVVLDFLLR